MNIQDATHSTNSSPLFKQGEYIVFEEGNDTVLDKAQYAYVMETLKDFDVSLFNLIIDNYIAHISVKVDRELQQFHGELPVKFNYLSERTIRAAFRCKIKPCNLIRSGYDKEKNEWYMELEMYIGVVFLYFRATLNDSKKTLRDLLYVLVNEVQNPVLRQKEES